ncbi:nucleotidyltransferase domain-containing protein [Zavarzinella formosa]|uniref:nucleotidyltransferase domain-containing protein n=1 Tax=Zavarzinella formosa TaxID=360055 RepID=UPI0002D3AEE6|nr:nucleotidyltransferase domain-containing protein [Zavarzinella formosa]
MGSVIQRLAEKQIAKPPKFLPKNVHYETLMGSVAYGVSTDTSDMDVYGFCIPPKEEVFPHLRGEITGFGTQKERFTQYQEHHLKDADALAGHGREVDVTIYNIVDYFQLVMKNNPNMVDSLFTPETCVLHITRVGTMVREARRMFLHKGCWHTFKGYAYAQMHKMSTKEPVGKRRETVAKYGYDVKFAYHTVRLLNEAEMILAEGDLDLQRNREQLKSIRRGEWTEAQIRDYFAKKEGELETLYLNSGLPVAPDESKIKTLLLSCLEEHYGNLEKCVVNPERAAVALREVAAVLEKYNDLL